MGKSETFGCRDRRQKDYKTTMGFTMTQKGTL